MITVRQWPSGKPGKRGPRTKKARLVAEARRQELENDFRPEVEIEPCDPEIVALLRARRAS